MRRKVQGSITVFLTLVIVIIAAFIFALLEGVRVKVNSMKAYQVSGRSVESVFSGYDKELWEEYEVFLYPAGTEEGQFDEKKVEAAISNYVYQNLRFEQEERIPHGIDFLKEDMEQVELQGYELAFDREGRALQRQLSEVMKGRITQEAAESMMEFLVSGENYLDGDKEERLLQQAEDARKEASERQKNNRKGAENATGSSRRKREGIQENPMDRLQLLKKQSVFALVLKEPGKVSGLALENYQRMEERQQVQGNMKVQSDNILQFPVELMYSRHYFTNYLQSKEGHPLNYEMEYLIGGKSTDKENLEITIKQLLLLRELANFTYLLQDAEKSAQALTMAATIGGVTGMAPFVPALKIGILLSWAYVEGILDVRSMLEGNKVELVKTSLSWSTDLFRLPQALQLTPKEKDKGFTYSDYLMILLYLKENKKVIYRMGDVMEAFVRKARGEDSFRIDLCMQSMECEINLLSKPLFSGFILIDKPSLKLYRHTNQISYSYVK
ncbi:MAG: DUF5702 domain-containing protein [Lachnospiraceae bacterium]